MSEEIGMAAGLVAALPVRLRRAAWKSKGIDGEARTYSIADNSSSDAAAPSNDAGGEDAEDWSSREETFARKYDDLGPVDFAKEVIQFGYWLERNGHNLSPAQREDALAEYSFLQGRLSFWLAYEYKPPTAHGPLLSAALKLYQGAINGKIVRVGHLPESMVDVLGVAAAFTDGPPRRPSGDPSFVESPGEPVRTPKKQVSEEAPVAARQAPKEMEGLGGIADNRHVEITWNQGIDDQGKPFEGFIKKEDPEVIDLEPPPNSKGFDLFKPVTREAISAKTLNTLTAGRIKDPKIIFNKLKVYVDNILDYEPYRSSDLDPADIETKTLHVAIPEFTSQHSGAILTGRLSTAKTMA